MHQHHKRLLRYVLIYGTVSILIGIIFLLFIKPQALLSPMVLLRNAGYSLMLGGGLFLAGRFFNSIERRYLAWLKHPFRSLLITLLTSFLYSSAVIFFTNWFWYIWIYGNKWNVFWQWGWVIVAYEYAVFYAIALFMFAKSFFNEWQLNVTEKERISHQTLALQYETLSNQVNPHFLFNSLNVLLSLIDHDTEAAKKFTRQLAAFYRQLLSLKDQQIIPLQQEMDLMRNYLDLLQIRFQNALKVSIDCPPSTSYTIIPLTLQLLVENAIKHNVVSNDNPLHLEIRLTDKRLTVRNTLKKKAFVAEPSHIGLKNLNERYLFLAGQGLNVTETETYFEVTIPLIENET